jgi:hypothetical protein
VFARFISMMHASSWNSSRISRLVCRAIPCLLIVLGTLGLIGCIYLPFPEHGIDSRQKDFRPLLDANNAASPIRRGTITRAGIISLLGPPVFDIPDQHASVYQFDTEEGLQIWPLCFTIQPTCPIAPISSTS